MNPANAGRMNRLVAAIVERRNTANDARQAYDDASAGVDHDALHNAAARLNAADRLSEAVYELCHHLDNLLRSIEFESMLLSERKETEK